METLKDFLWPIVAIGGLGAFIDFLIGRVGQERAKDFLLRWWVRFDDVRLNNFGREEGLFAGRLIERWFGKRIWSFRRIAVCFVVFILILAVLYVISFLEESDIFCYYCHYNRDWLVWYVLFFSVIFYFSASISFLKFFTFGMAKLCGVGKKRNLLVFLVMLIINSLMIAYVTPLFAGLRETILAKETMFMNDHGRHYTLDYDEDFIFPMFFINFYLKNREIDRTALFVLACFPSLFRFVLSIIFVGSFLLRPLIMRPISLVWARIIESEKPVFTLTFGFAGAFASAISEAAKHL